MNIEETVGYGLAMSFKPFIDPKCTEHMEIVNDMAKAINRSIPASKKEPTEDLKMRVKQLLSALDYGSLTDFQAKCVLLVERELKL